MPSQLYFAGHKLDLDFDPSLGLELLQAQVMTLTGLDAARQLLFAVDSAKKAGQLKTDEDLIALNADEDSIACLDAEQFYVPPPSSTLTIAAASSSGTPSVSAADTCTRAFSALSPLVQPRHGYTHTDGKNCDVCAACAGTCRSFGAGGSTDTLPFAPLPTASDEYSLRTEFRCQCSEAGECLFAPQYGQQTSEGVIETVRPALLKGAIEQVTRGMGAVQVQAITQGLIVGKKATPQGAGSMVQRLRGMMEAFRRYCHQPNLATARGIIPVGLLVKRATDACLHEDVSGGKDFHDELLLALLRWFKNDGFFKWTNNMACTSCGSTATEGIGGTRATLPEETSGLAGIVEIYKCTACSSLSRFPRYNDPLKLLTWRQGRCGEWANAFTFCCVAMGFKARHVTNWEDHVWTEVYSTHRGRWLHLDSCECACDTPLVYEAGWGKQISYCIAVGADEVVDVSKRYTKDFSKLLTRRKDMPEALLRLHLAFVSTEQRAFFHDKIAAPASTVLASGVPRSSLPSRFALLDSLQHEEERQMQASASFDDGVRAEDELHGRISGSLLWRAQRRELGATTSDSAGAGSAAGTGSATESGTSTVLLEPSDTPRNAWLEREAVVVGGWRHLLPSSSTSATTAATPSLVAPADFDASKVRSMSSFGVQALAVTDDNRLWWRSIPSAPVVAAAAGTSATPSGAAGGKWKPVSVVTASAESSSSLSAWPSSAARVEAVACEHKKLSFYALLSSTASTSEGARFLELWKVEYGALPSATVDGSAGAPPAKPKEGWVASKIIGAAPLHVAEATSSASPVSASVASDRLWIIAGGQLYRSAFNLSSTSSTSAMATIDGQGWEAVASAAGCSRLTAVTLANSTSTPLLLAFKSRPQPPAPAEAAEKPPGEEGSGDVIVFVPRRKGSEPRVSIAMIAASEAPAGAAGSKAPVSVSVPASFLDASSPATEANGACITLHGSFSGLEADDWVALVPVGQNSEPRWSREKGCSPPLWQLAAYQGSSQGGTVWCPPKARGLPMEDRAKPLSSVTIPVHIAGVASRPSFDADLATAATEVRKPSLSVAVGAASADANPHHSAWPAGLYELRYYRHCKDSCAGGGLGKAYGRCVAVSESPVLIIRPAASSGDAPIGGSWVPLIPAANVTGLAAASVSVGGSTASRLVALTKNSDVWDVRVPRALPGMLLEKPAEVVGDAGAVVEAAEEARAAALLALPPAARIQLLFAQLTKGCIASAAPAGALCEHPKCAGNPAFGPQPPKAAALMSAQLCTASTAASSAGPGSPQQHPFVAAVCPRMPLPAPSSEKEKAGNLRGSAAAASS